MTDVCLCNMFSHRHVPARVSMYYFSPHNIATCQSTEETAPGISNTEENERNLVVDLEDSELCDMLGANSEETIFQEMLYLAAMDFDEVINSGFKKIPIATML